MSISLPGARRLVLAGGEAGWPWLWLAAGAAAVLLLLWLYREERRLVSRRAGLCLLGLRLIAAGVLVLALFEPIAARTFRQTVRGRLVVAVDTSESMETTDPDRTADERDRLARVLALSPGATETLDRLPRREVARRLLGGPLARLEAEHQVEAQSFALHASGPATLASLAKLLKSPPKPGDPAARTTDWLPALEQALKEGGGGGAPVLGVVLLTDGQRNAPADTAPTVDRLAARGIPVFPVLIGSTRPPPDAAVAALRAPESVYRGDTATVEARLKLDGQADRDVAVTLEGPGIGPVRQTVRAPADGRRPSVVFRVPLDRPGAVPLTVRVGPVEGDARPDNDRRTAVVQVADDKARVLLVDGEARWEFQYLRNALARDPRVEVQAVVFHQPNHTASVAPDASSTYAETLPTPDPATPGVDPLGGFDAIVLGDVDPADLPADAWTRLEAYVAERGGALVFSPGPRFAEALTAVGAVRALLPVLDPRPVPVPTDADPDHPALPPGLPFVPAAEAIADAASWPMLQLAADAEESGRRWAGLPRLPWILAGQTKPGATTLATTTTGGDDPASNSASTVFAVQPYGLGKTVVVGTDGTWRWRHRVGDAYHHRFWGQVVRWAASGKLGAGNAFVRFGPRAPRVDEGGPVVFEARVGETARGLPANLMLAARVYPVRDGQAAAEALAVVSLRPVAGRPRTFEGTAPGLPAGPYVVRLDAPGAAEALGLATAPGPKSPVPEATLEVVPRDGPERVELAAARDPLDRLASATGGQVFTDDRADTLPPLLHGRVKTVERTEEVPLWNQPAALLLFLGLLTAEWLARKWLGLP